VLLERANLSFVVMHVMSNAYGSLCFSAIFFSQSFVDFGAFSVACRESMTASGIQGKGHPKSEITNVKMH